jgi:hypothetical protein
LRTSLMTRFTSTMSMLARAVIGFPCTRASR